MAKEAPTEKKEVAAAAPAVSAAGNGGWLPVIVVLVLMPVLSFVMAEFVLFPRLEKRLGAAAPAEGADHGKPAHGKSAHGKGQAEKVEPTYAFEFKDIVSNLAGSMKSRYIKVSFTAYSADPKFAEIVEHNRAKLLDTTLSVLSQLSLADLEDSTVKNKVRTELVLAYEAVLHGRVIEEIYFSEFVIQ